MIFRKSRPKKPAKSNVAFQEAASVSANSSKASPVTRGQGKDRGELHIKKGRETQTPP